MSSDFNGDGHFDGMDMAYIESGDSDGIGNNQPSGSSGGCWGCLKACVGLGCSIVLFFLLVSCTASCIAG